MSGKDKELKELQAVIFAKSQELNSLIAGSGSFDISQIQGLQAEMQALKMKELELTKPAGGVVTDKCVLCICLRSLPSHGRLIQPRSLAAAGNHQGRSWMRRGTRPKPRSTRSNRTTTSRSPCSRRKLPRSGGS